MVFDYALVSACPLLFWKCHGLRPKKAVDSRIIANLNFLRYGKLPTFRLTNEARDIFWNNTCFQVDWKDLGNVALGFDDVFDNDASFLVPHGRIRRITINIGTEGKCPKNEDDFVMDDPSRKLRRLIRFPVLQKIEIIIRMPVVSYNDKLIRHRVSQIQGVCTKLKEKTGNGFTVIAERSAFESYEEEPYPWDACSVFGQAAEPRPEAPPFHSDDDHNDDTDRGDSDSEDGSDDISIMYQRQDLTWIWMPPTEETLKNVAKDEGTWMEEFNVRLFERKPSHE